jgi:hypothetical protein
MSGKSDDIDKFPWKELILAGAVSLVVLWAGYGFSIGHL